MVELDIDVRHRLITTLTDLTITANNLQHDIARNRAGMLAPVDGFGKWLGGYEDWADVTKHSARRV